MVPCLAWFRREDNGARKNLGDSPDKCDSITKNLHVTKLDYGIITKLGGKILKILTMNIYDVSTIKFKAEIINI